jgi:membrane-associated phospholipid phosphatase
MVATCLLLRDLLRRRSAIFGALALPFVFHAVILATSPQHRAVMTLPILAEPAAQEMDGDPPLQKNPMVEQLIDDGSRELAEQEVSVVFLGGAAVGFLAAFVAFYLVHHRLDTDRRLVASGYSVLELHLSRVLALVSVVLPIAACETALACGSFTPAHVGGLFMAYVALGLVYGSFGLLLGVVAQNELAGVLGVVLVTNVDVGWLQNPAYYANSRSKWLIRALPGHHAVQLALANAFEPRGPPVEPELALAAMIVALLGGAAAAYAFRTRSRGPTPRSNRTAYLLIMLLAYAIWIAAFEVVGRYAATLPSHDLTTSWDRAIPLVPLAVWPYEFCYVLPFIACLVIRNWHFMNRALLASVLVNVVAFATYIVFPVAFPRPVLGTSLSERVLAVEYAWDFSPGANNMPSLHVAMSFLWLFACHEQGFGRAAEAAMAAVVLLISLSTLLVKQHLIVDVLSGALCARAAWTAAHFFYERNDYFAMKPLQALRRLFGWDRGSPAGAHAE